MSFRKILIQSISDIITNSSSEVFCTIDSDNELEEIYEFLKPLFNPYADSELEPSISRYDSKIYIELPYSTSPTCEHFFKAGLEAILDGKFKCNIKYEDTIDL